MKLSLRVLAALSCLSLMGCPLVAFLRDFEVPEDCLNGFDDNGDGAKDCLDSECSEELVCLTIAGLQEIDLGVVLNGEIKSFDIPADAIGFTILILGEREEDLGIETLENPQGEFLIQGFSSITMRYFPGREANALVIPPNDDPINAPLPGAWKLSVGSSDRAPVVKIFVRRGAFQGGVLDFKLYFPEGLRACATLDCNGGQGDVVNADNAALFAEVQGALNSFFVGSYQQLGFAQGTVQFFDVDSSFLTVDSFAEYDQLLRQSAIGGLGGMHIFFTQDFSDESFENAIGVAPALPGAFLTAGNENTGVVSQIMFDPEAQNNLTGNVLSHEVGHFLGLAHTTEFDGRVDFVSDTPSCDLAVISSDQSQCPDVSFVMFPTLFSTAGAFSAGQQRTMNGGPLYR